MLPLLLKTHRWEANILNRLARCLQTRQPAPAPRRLSALVCDLQERSTESRNVTSWPTSGKKAACPEPTGKEPVTRVVVAGRRGEQEGWGEQKEHGEQWEVAVALG